MALTLRYLARTTVPVEAECIAPDRLRGLSTAEIERLQIFHGNRTLPLAELFAVTGDGSDSRIDLEGDLAGVHWLGTKMASGEIHVHGNCGRHLGSEISGGTIEVHGHAGDWVGGEMSGGKIRVHGNAGHLIGAAYRGSKQGMTGGSILIDGDVGSEIGSAMRRGLIAIGGACGDAAGFSMIAGTILVFGACGIRLGAGMKRGTIGLFALQPPQLLPTFRLACRLRTPFLALLVRELENLGFPVDRAAIPAELLLYRGDLVSLGKGEVWMRAP